MYDRRVGEETFEFGSSGLLMRSNKLMFDRGTKTLWNQLTGEPVVGVLAEADPPIRLEVLAVVLTSWGEWERRHPETTVLDPETGYTREYELGAAYGEYFASPEQMFMSPSLPAGERAKEQLFAVRAGGDERAYSLTALSEAGGILHDRLGGKEIVLVGGRPVAAARVELPESWQAGAGVAHADELDEARFERALQQEGVSLEDLTADMWLAIPEADRKELLARHVPGRRARGPLARIRNEMALRGLIAPVRAYESGGRVFSRVPGDPGSLVDETGTRWLVGEEALAGPDDRRLPRLGGHLVFRFGWRGFFPVGRIHGD